ncbi:MAG: gamma-glutamyltransferase family protein [Rubrivivax sp.]|nr:gamma-glutamyltransferase family protein [Rubrivivax sp.]
MASTAHPLASQAALQMLAEGGSAVDATIAAQMVLGLVEPQSSGIGGGLLMMVWDSPGQRLRSYDGLSSAPARSTAGLRVDTDGRLLPLNDVSRGGRSVGVPGALMALELAHRQHGRLPWARLFEPAIALATQGYPFAPYAQGILARDRGAVEHPEFLADHFDRQGQALPAGTVLRNPAYAETLKAVASKGVAAFWRDGAAQRLVAAAQRGAHPSLMTVADITGYRAVEREPLCAPVRSVKVCMSGPPSFGGVTVLQMLQMLADRAPSPTAGDLDGPAFWHTYVEAGRMAQADRRQFVGDPDHNPVPTSALLAPSYLRQRAATINPERAAGPVRPGNPSAATVSRGPNGTAVDGGDATETGAISADQTSQIVVVDGTGNIASTTTTINLNFGARLRVDGYVLNNALTNFSGAPEAGRTNPNQMAPGKRPVTSMSPLVVFDAAGQPVVAGGSAGGGQIVDYIARSLIEMLWLGRSPAQVLAAGHVTTALAPRVQLEAGTPRAELAAALRARGHDVAVEPTVSGAGFVLRVPGGWLGAADPRRDGAALGR